MVSGSVVSTFSSAIRSGEGGLPEQLKYICGDSSGSAQPRYPGTFSASDVSMLSTFACEYGLRTSSAYTMPGTLRSSVYFPEPSAFSNDSRRGVSWFTTSNLRSSITAAPPSRLHIPQ